MPENKQVMTVKDTKYKDLFLISCGYENCIPSYSYGPVKRPYYVLHFVLSGKGSYYLNHRHYKIEENQCFLIEPNTFVYYQADQMDPWYYTWLCFNGEYAPVYLKRLNLSNTTPVFSCRNFWKIESVIQNIMQHHQLVPADEPYIQSCLYLIFAYLMEEANLTYQQFDFEDNFYIEKAISYIEANYFRYIKVSDIANHLAINRSYLFTLFKKQLNKSPQQFLTETRITKARELLITTELSVEDISQSCGYNDAFAFSTAFKKIFLVSPREYRKIYKDWGNLHKD